ncbi:MAG: hypothetical protein KKD39_06335 [Candidatus Altiarchaeota archaeon]|nr:hypothetical protein [Candidatus Altiarchaeota archaeon]
MDESMTVFVEHDVSDATAWNLKKGTLVVYPTALAFYYTHPDVKHEYRKEDLIHLYDIEKIIVKDINWFIRKFIWSDRKVIVVETHEGEKKYYVQKIDKFLDTIRMLNPQIQIEGYIIDEKYI